MAAAISANDPGSPIVAPSAPHGDTYHHGDLRAACIAAAIRLVDDGGVEAVTIRGVARLTGVSHTAPLHHFRDRDELLEAVAQAGFDRLLTDARLAVHDVPTDPVEQIRRYGRAYVRRAITSPGLFRLMFGDAACDVGFEAYQLLIDLVARSGLAHGDPEPTALIVWAQVHGLAGLYAEGKLGHELEDLEPGQVPPRALVALDRLIELLTHASTGVRP
jgi:AcrR family transcriptional regulator